MENNQQSTTSQAIKRNTACKIRIGSILSAKQIIETEKLKGIQIGDRHITRVNVIANVIDKYIQEDEKKFGSLTLDDGTGQIKIKAFGEDVDKFFSPSVQGDTLIVIGLLRTWNNEIYILPEIIKKKEPLFLLIRKLETEKDELEKQNPSATPELKNKIVDLIKESEKDGGIDIEKLIIDLKEHPDSINSEIKKLLEDGLAYEPRPGKIRWLG